MKMPLKTWLRPVLFFFITLILIFVFYVRPGFSHNAGTVFYNIFSALVIFASVFLYTFAIRDSYRLRYLNSNKLAPDVNPKWASLWKLYQESFLVGKNKTTAIASSYFSPDNMLAASSERIPVLTIIKAMPGTYTGLGILGTFMGFSAGLANFNTSSSETMQESIKTLLTGINTAFNTSIVGVVLSIIFNFIFLQPLLKRLEGDCNDLCDRLDRDNYVDSEEHFKELMSFEEGGQTWEPGAYNRQMLKELKSQTMSLANFTTDLSDSMQNLAGALVSSYRQEMNRMISEDLKPLLERLAYSADKLQADKAESADQALQGIVDRLNQTLVDFMKDFRENVSGQTKREMEGLATQLRSAGESIGSLPALMDNLKTSFATMTEQSMKAMNETALQGSTLQSETIVEIRQLAEQVKQNMDSYAQVLSIAELQNKRGEKIAEKLEEVSDATAVASSDLTRSFKEYMVRNETLITTVGKEAENLRLAASSVQSAAEGFRGLDEGLAKSFHTINAGLEEYSAVTKSGLEGQLEKYTTSIAKFSDRISGAIEQLGEFIQDLQEVIDSRSHRQS